MNDSSKNEAGSSMRKRGVIHTVSWVWGTMNEDIIGLDKKATRLGYELMDLEDKLDVIIEGVGNAVNEDEKAELMHQKTLVESEIVDIKDERHKLNERLINSF
ncbi:hypothetical protein [Methanolobus sp. ZRKC5]|uniref:hypothetical protein n=1 Tax=unclassified Methanolobus TaxID=2629569 RepID=UPI00313D8B15